ncbi:hypothetical protein [Jidongwangia harbinensis]|uniref:hypothetical protein n=1 Tax=Jidongwangia harbinensis TaxID=2878561 RepID=UPI001CDA49AF|nr:hypothetical protein [Jidongwangia harbinensis]MCA2214826.1 hypothetical protein [Jidongwangia harbinensis]
MADETNRPDDDMLAQGEELERRSAAAKLFDVRLVIGGLFVVYGVIVALLGLFDSAAEIDKAQGVRINLWMGLAMLGLGGFFLLWRWWRPLQISVPEPGADDDQRRPGGH